MIHRGFRYKLEPTAEQAEKLAQFAGTTRFVYNLALEQRRDFWRQYRAATGGRLNFVNQGREIKQLRAAADWIEDAPCGALHQALRDLDRAFANYFSGRANFPTPRCKGVHDTFRLQIRVTDWRPINAKWAAVKLPKVGWIKFRQSRAMKGRATSATFALDALGWFVSFACEIDHEAPANHLPGVGIDRGVANTIALSTGEMLSTPCTTTLERRKKRAQRILARRQRGSVRYRKQRQRLSRITAKIARVRADWRHKATTDIADRFGLVAIEALQTTNMVKLSRGLARSIHEQGWRGIETSLAYKLEERGGTLIKVNPAYTSQTCSDCGTIDKASRENQASFACRHCGFTAHADTNAAINIHRQGMACVEGSGCGPVEAQTVTHDRLAA